MTAVRKSLESILSALSEEKAGEVLDFAALLLYREQTAAGVWDTEEDAAWDADMKEKIHRGMREPIEWDTSWEALRKDVSGGKPGVSRRGALCAPA